MSHRTVAPRGRRRACRALALAVLALAGVTQLALAQGPATVTVDDVRVRGAGKHTLLVTVLDAADVPVTGSDLRFHATVDGKPVEDLRAEPGRSAFPGATVTVIADASLFAPSGRADLEQTIQGLAAALQPTDRIRVLAAGRRVRAREADARAVDALTAGLGSLHADERPALYDALADAVRGASRLPADRAGVVVLITRGTEDGSRRGPLDVVALARSRRLTRVFMILLGSRSSSPDHDRLRGLAANTGGALVHATSLQGLGPLVARLARRGLDSWRVTFRAPDWSRRQPRHQVSVVVQRGELGRTAALTYESGKVQPPPWWSTPLPWLILGLVAVGGGVAWVVRRRRQRGLLVHDGDEWDGTWYEVFEFPVTIGAAAGNDLVLADPQVSRNHAVLERRGRTVELADLNSENGTFVNGEPVSRRLLADGDRLSFGPAVHLIYETRD